MSIDNITQNPTKLYLVDLIAYDNLFNRSGNVDPDLSEPARELLERPTICGVVYYVAKLNEVKNIR